MAFRDVGETSMNAIQAGAEPASEPGLIDVSMLALNTNDVSNEPPKSLGTLRRSAVDGTGVAE